MSRKQRTKNQWRGSRSPNDTPWMRAQLAGRQPEPAKPDHALTDDAIYQDQIRFGREQFKEVVS
jgi:hypothetical protein